MDETRLQEYIDELGSNPERATVLDILDDLPESNSYDYELYLEGIIEGNQTIDREFEYILESDQFPTSIDDSKVQFAAFIGNSLYLLKRTDLSELSRYLDDFESEYGDEPLYTYIRSRFLRKRGRPTTIEEAVELSRTAAERLPDHAGVIHNYAQSVALAIEEGILEEDEDELERVQAKLQEAINDYSQIAQFYCTKGRLIAIIDEDYERAKDQIRQAMDREDSTRADYPIRVGEYQFHLSRIDRLNYERELDRKLGEAENRIQDTEESTRKRIEAYQNRTLQSLGFFAAILAVIVSSTQVIVGLGLPNALPFILLLDGSILIVFAGFTVMLPQEELPYRRISIAAGLGVLLIVIGIYIAQPTNSGMLV